MSEKRMASFYDSARLCWKRQCEECPLSEYNNGLECGCGTYKISYPDMANEIILKWCDEHPLKTYLDDYLEKLPNCRRSSLTKMPVACVNIAYGLSIECPHNCSECWSRPMEVSDE